MLLGRARRSSAVRGALGAAAVTVFASVLTGCSESAVPPEPATSASAAPTSPADVGAPTDAEPSPSANRSLTDRLLEAGRMPGLNRRFTWTDAGTRADEGRRPFGTCHEFALTSIGAIRVVSRAYDPKEAPDRDGAATAGHLVAEFADQRTARRAFDVLKAWRGTCEEELTQYRRADVGGLEPVEVTGGEAGWYLLIYGPPAGAAPDEGYFDAQGLARVGRRIAVLQIRVVGQDYNYPTGQEPMVAAVRTAAAELT